MSIEKSTILRKLKEIPREDLEDIAKKQLGLKARDDFKTSTWEKVKDGDLIDKLAEICVQNNIYINQLLRIKVLYRNKKNFIIQKRLGNIDYYEEILKSAVKEFGLSETPDYEELGEIALTVYKYISSVRFDNALEHPVYPNSSHLRRIERIAGYLSTIGGRNLKNEEAYKEFLEEITDAFREADLKYYGDIMSR